MRTRHYYCPACDVFGQGPVCWCCDSPRVERDTPRVDVYLDWDDEQGTQHRCPGGGGCNPLLTIG